jgi:hypothetical protein
MQRYVSAAMPVPPAGYLRADLEFEGVEHGTTSFVAHVHLNAPDADEATPRTPAGGYAGHFTVFAHGDCWGDVGHCDLPGPASPFDRRPPHALTPIHVGVEITEALRALGAGEEIRVTVLAFPVGNGKERSPLKFQRLRFVTYS